MAHPPTLRRYLHSQKADHLTHCYGGQHVEFPLPLKVLGASGVPNGLLEFAVVIAIWCELQSKLLKRQSRSGALCKRAKRAVGPVQGARGKDCTWAPPAYSCCCLPLPCERRPLSDARADGRAPSRREAAMEARAPKGRASDPAVPHPPTLRWPRAPPACPTAGAAAAVPAAAAAATDRQGESNQR